MKKAPYYKEYTRIYNKLTRGKRALTDQETQWLTKYKANQLDGLPRRAADLATSSAPNPSPPSDDSSAENAGESSTGPGEVSPPSSTPNEVPDTPPEIELPPIDVSYSSATTTPTPNSQNGDASGPHSETRSPSEESTPQTGKPSGDGPANPFVGKIGDIAEGAYVGGLNAWSKWLVANEGPAIPDALIQTGGLGAKFLAEKYLGGEIDPEKMAMLSVAMPIAVAGIPTYRIVQEKRAKKKAAPAPSPIQQPVEVKKEEKPDEKPPAPKEDPLKDASTMFGDGKRKMGGYQSPLDGIFG